MNLGIRSGSRVAVTPRCAAFTLLELMIVCSLMAILLSLAIPEYRRYLLRTHRSAAIETLLAAASCQERIYASEFKYDTSRCLQATDGDRYRIRIEPAAAPASATFTVLAEPMEAQREDPCGRLSLDQSGTRGISGPAQRLRQCWQGR